eukprot:1280157-Pleurochrysis_carterae.AAC.1
MTKHNGSYYILPCWAQYAVGSEPADGKSGRTPTRQLGTNAFYITWNGCFLDNFELMLSRQFRTNAS